MIKTREQQIRLMHQRAEELSRFRDRITLSLTAFVSVGLTAGLLLLMPGLSGTSYRPVGDVYTAASLLDESFGGYIFAAVLAFMAGAAVTVFCMKYRERSAADRKLRPDQDKRTQADRNGGEDGFSR